MNGNSRSVHQTLHGYREGHRLLASSIALEREIQREMLVLSDMSGAGMQPGFEEYYSGYPINGSELYAFSRTWYASEMPRPGCVWTHTLLVPFTLLSPALILALYNKFQHPPERGLEFYAQALSIEDILCKPNKVSELYEIDKKLLNPLMLALYGEENQRPVAIVSNKPSRHEDMVLQVWLRQWPSLQRNFKFCTGSISPRNVNGNPFDLQVIPTSQIRQHERTLKSLLIVAEKEGEANEEECDWIGYLWGQSVLKDDKNSLSQFLDSFTGSSRGCVGDISALHRKIFKNNQAPPSAYDFVAGFSSLFHGAIDEKPKLIKTMLGQDSQDARQRMLGICEEDLLLALSEVSPNHGFTNETLDIYSRAELLWKNNTAAALRLLQSLVEKGKNSIGIAIMETFASSACEADAAFLAKTNPRALNALVSLSPEIATYEGVWQELDRPTCLSILDSIALESVTNKTIDDIQRAIITAGKSSIAVEALELFGASFVHRFLTIINEQGNYAGETQEWSHMLSIDIKTTYGWIKENLQVHPRIVMLISQSLELHKELIQTVPMKAWLQAAIRLNGKDANLDEGEIYNVSAFLLGLALMSSGVEAGMLAEQTFPSVHYALEKGKLDWRAWKILEPLLPEIPWHWFRSWDRCERLRMAMRERGYKYQNNKY